MKKAVVLSYKADSKSAKYLTQHLEGRMITSREPIAADECIINWGGGQFSSSQWPAEWLNPPHAVVHAVEKLVAFHYFKLHGVPHPRWTFDPVQAKRWLEAGSIVLARDRADGMMGRGISLLNIPGMEVPPAAFYSQHVGHETEYRVHVFKGQPINIGIKVQLRGDANMLIRNADDVYWDFRHTHYAPPLVVDAGRRAVTALGLDFGAADVGYDGNVAHVFEVNSAPGTGHNTITRYAEAINRYLRTL